MEFVLIQQNTCATVILDTQVLIVVSGHAQPASLGFKKQFQRTQQGARWKNARAGVYVIELRVRARAKGVLRGRPAPS